MANTVVPRTAAQIEADGANPRSAAQQAQLETWMAGHGILGHVGVTDLAIRVDEIDAYAADGFMTSTRMSCPRRCGKDVRDHHSSDQINERCDTGLMSLDAMTEWFTARGAGRPRMITTWAALAEHYGKSEAELDALYLYDAIYWQTA